MKPAQRRKKGKTGENELYDILSNDGFNVQKCDASGAGKRDHGDIVLRYGKRKYLVEVKREESLPIKRLEKKRDNCDLLAMRKNRDVWKVYMDLDTLILLLLNDRS